MSMNLLHIASFAGNVGDIVNHQGFYGLMGISEKNIKKIEIRRFYNNTRELSFNKDILEVINSYDCLVLGGGGFFDIYWDDSYSGTTLDMTEAFIDGIKIPVIINAMGVHVDYNASKAISNFIKFFKYILEKKWFISLRNDGSMSRLKSIVADDIPKVHSVPDNGFAFNVVPYSGAASKYVGVSITNDLFSEKFNGALSLDRFNDEIADVCTYLIACGKKIIFFLHAPQDIKVLYEIQRRMGLKHFRNNIKVAPYAPFSLENAFTLNKLYSQCQFVIAMRFHANVLAIKNRVPVIGLAGHEQIKGLFDELMLKDQCVIVKDDFKEKLIELIEKVIDEKEKYTKAENDVMEVIGIQQNRYREQVTEIIKNF